MISKTSAAPQAQKLQQGLKKHLGKVKTVALGGESYAPAQINTALQTIVDSSSDLDAKKAAFHGAVEAQNKALEAARPMMQGLISYVYLTFGNANETLSRADFGLSPRKRREPTVETKAEALKKRQATRAAGGKKAKAQSAAAAATAPATIPPASGVASNAAPPSSPAPAKASGSGS